MGITRVAAGLFELAGHTGTRGRGGLQAGYDRRLAPPALTVPHRRLLWGAFVANDANIGRP
jgi:hypothetical protein